MDNFDETKEYLLVDLNNTIEDVLKEETIGGYFIVVVKNGNKSPVIGYRNAPYMGLSLLSAIELAILEYKLGLLHGLNGDDLMDTKGDTNE